MCIESALASLIEKLEQDCSLDEWGKLRQRSEALDELDAYLANEQSIATAIVDRAKAICARLECVNLKLYESIRRDIQMGAGARRLMEWSDPASLANSRGYDYLDELVSGVLQLEEPSAEVVKLKSEMVAYQPTPARHVFDLISRTDLTERDSFIDLGSGLGQVELTVSICTGAKCTGIELEPSYVECARKSARSLNLKNVDFIQGDVRAADLPRGTVFYLYTPFTGAILRDVLNALRQQCSRREIRVCTFGPCTQIVAEEDWLSVVGRLDTERIAIFNSGA